jgi:hypothetical protein
VAASGSPPSVASARTGRRVTPEEVSSKALIFLFCLCPPSLTLRGLRILTLTCRQLLNTQQYYLSTSSYILNTGLLALWSARGCVEYLYPHLWYLSTVFIRIHTHTIEIAPDIRRIASYESIIRAVTRATGYATDNIPYMKRSRREAQARGQTVSKHDARQAYGKPPAPRAATHEMNTAAASRWNQVLASTTPGMTAKARPLGCRANGDE